MVGGQNVEAVVANERGDASDRVERPLDLGPDPLLGLAATSSRRSWVCGAGEVEEVGAVGVVELQRSSQCIQDARGDAVIADGIAFMVPRPRRASISELWVMPTDQA